MIAGETWVIEFFLFKQVSPNRCNIKMEEGYKSMENKA